ncbi:MaoC family dehydratase [Marinobacterium nitratireducens]|uniref:MaoC family dehydratase n=1 Tax=Marinobacterium nitratireducens TaxID=518897 RepID=A0A917ZJ49_9GAMM|nr:MaoC family dehydratase [Marinobacterium nitratireducens]GGO84351.1 MaoC family dehydratase [Marinobacterium nitratireducens]
MEAKAASERSADPLYLEDIQVGDLVETKEFTVTRDMIIAFAEQYDPQPMHLDEKAAHDTIFGELVGSGWQTLVLTMRLLVDARLLGGTPLIGAELKNIRFHAPMRPGNTLRAGAEVTAIRPSKSRPDRGFIDLKVTTRNADGMTLATQNWSLVMPLRSTSPERNYK